jgi:uncharacterized protein YdeI (BOF family)
MYRIVCALFSSVCLCACHHQGGTVLGKAPAGEARNIIAVWAGETPVNITLKGRLVEKCPVAGCWFYLQDNTGMIKIDTKAAGFVVVDVPLQTMVTVSGKVLNESEGISIQATGLRY